MSRVLRGQQRIKDKANIICIYAKNNIADNCEIWVKLMINFDWEWLQFFYFIFNEEINIIVIFYQ